jgi:hypothetical protein
MAGAVGDAATATAIAAQRKTVGAAFHAQWYNADKKCYNACAQTENAMALWLGDTVVPAHLLDGVVNQTAHDVLETNNVHTTSGIIGIKLLFEAMSRLGRADVPVLMAMQTSYPSYGYMITNKYEPATTLWELWNSDSQGPSMNSRNHIMFGTISSWFYRYVCGIDVAEGSRGYDVITIRPTGLGVPGSDLSNASCSVGSPHGTVASAWTAPTVPGNTSRASTCGVGTESQAVMLSCAGGATIDSVLFASYGTPLGDCGGKNFTADPKCNADISKIVQGACVGKESCVAECDQGACEGTVVPDPCFGVKKHLAVNVHCTPPPPPPPTPPHPAPADTAVTLDVTVPVGSTARVRVPLVAAVGHVVATVVIKEGGSVVWEKGRFVAGGAGGIASGVVDVVGEGEGVMFVVESGVYAFSADEA